MQGRRAAKNFGGARLSLVVEMMYLGHIYSAIALSGRPQIFWETEAFLQETCVHLV